MEGRVLSTAWKSFSQTLPPELANAPLLKYAFAAGAAWATETLTEQREKICADAARMVKNARQDHETPNVEVSGCPSGRTDKENGT